MVVLLQSRLLPILCIAFALAVPRVGYASNLLQNASFEVEGSQANAAYHWEWENPDWHGSTWGSASRRDWRHYPTNAGAWQATICGEWAEQGNAGGWWQEAPATPGAVYEASAWFWADDGNPNGPWTAAMQGIKIEFLSGEENGQTLLSAVTNTFDDVVQVWTRKTVQGVAPASCTWVRVVVFAGGIGWEGALQFDEVSLVSVEKHLAPQDVLIESVTRSNDSLAISWNSVAHDIYGRSKAVSHYNIYASTDPLFVPDRDAYSNLAATSTATSLTLSNVFTSATSTFYYVTAVGADGSESLIFTDMIYKISQSIDCPEGSNAFTWLGLPYASPWTNASALAAANPSADRLYRFLDTNQTYEVWDAVTSTGTDFGLVAGEAYGVEVSTSTFLHVYGRHAGCDAFTWTFSSNRFNHHWISIPPNSPYITASNLALAVPNCTKVAFYNPASGDFGSWFLLGEQWMGSNFALIPGVGVLVSIASNTTWAPAMIYPKVEVSLSSHAGFVDTAPAVEMTASVIFAASDIVEYAWDEDGDGELDAISSAPEMARSRSDTNTGVWWPTFRIKDERGLHGLAFQRYDALSMSLSFSNQAFRAGLGETGIISYASSTAGYFSVYIYDVSNNVVRVLESNVWHEGGAVNLRWDGLDDTAAFVSNGIYYAVIEQAVGSNTATYDPRSLLLASNITADIIGISVASTFNPYAGGNFPIHYVLPSASLVTILITGETNDILAVVCSNAMRGAGANVDYWNGRLLDGGIMPAGQIFNVSINATSIGANALIVMQPVSGIRNLSASNTRFMPAANPYGRNTNTVTLTYDLSASTDVRVEIKDTNGGVVQNGFEPGKPSGANQTVWDGRNAAGRSVAAGLYSVTVWCESGAGTGHPATVWVEAYY